jgi:hypothetical protein
MDTYFVTGRIPGDDDDGEDSGLYVGEQDSREAAVVEFERMLHNIYGLTEADVARLYREHGQGCFVNCVILGHGAMCEV